MFDDHLRQSTQNLPPVVALDCQEHSAAIGSNSSPEPMRVTAVGPSARSPRPHSWLARGEMAS